jgi:hypothetical protein
MRKIKFPGVSSSIPMLLRNLVTIFAALRLPDTAYNCIYRYHHCVTAGALPFSEQSLVHGSIWYFDKLRAIIIMDWLSSCAHVHHQATVGLFSAIAIFMCASHANSQSS